MKYSRENGLGLRGGIIIVTGCEGVRVGGEG